MTGLILENASFPTHRTGRAAAEAMAIEDGRISAIGTRDEVAAAAKPGARRVDLGGATVIPGFNDAHAHLWKMGQLMTGMLDLRATSDLAELGRSVESRAAGTASPAWILGRGYNEARMTGGVGPTRTHLDRAAPGRAVYLTRTCGHIAVASSRALELGGVGPDTPDPAGGRIQRDASGAPTGVLEETAMGLVSGRVPEPTAAEFEAMVVAAARHQLALGITSSSDAGLTPGQLDAYRALDRRGALPFRVNAMALRRPVGGTVTFDLPATHLSPFLRIDTIKLLADGGLSGATAALSVPYRHCDHRGLLRLDAAEIVELTHEAHARGLRLAIHAIGDAAIGPVLDAFERLGPPPSGRGHRIEHFGLPDAAQLERAQRLGLTVVPQAVFLHDLAPNFRSYLPDAFLGRSYPLRDMFRAGLAVALSSDAPVVADDSPLLGLHCAVMRAGPGGAPLAPAQAISTEEALAAYTLGGAAASGDEANRGSIAPSLWADLAVLDRNPLAVPPGELASIRVRATLVAGRFVFEA